ncbi:MAG: four helix bundle protein [Chloroflexi bacterium]|nr:four helix bundle protein [Chloroflexota bacterium]
MDYQEWEKTVPDFLKNDSLWKMSMYRAALFASSLGWQDVTKLYQDKRTVGVAEQLFEALGSIHANLAEGYSRGSSKDRARFYEYALGSARESRSWYFDGRHVLGEEILNHRGRLLTRIIQLGLTMIPQQRGKSLHEAKAQYEIQHEIVESDDLLSWSELKNVPMPTFDV